MADGTGGRVCVIGAGVAGLATARVLQDDGFAVTVFDKEDQLGGVWSANRTYPGLRTNSPRECYAFSDHPYPATADDFPAAAQVRAYLQSYAQRFGLTDHLRLRTQVVSVTRAPATGAAHPGFAVSVQDVAGRNAPETLHFDFVVVCSGAFSEPYVPEFAGRARFAGPVLHSSQVPDPALFEGKRVVVVGAGKSALDCAGFAARHGQTAMLVQRKAHWMMPRYFFGLVRCDWAVITRFSEVLIPYHRLNRFEALVHGPGAGLVRTWWWGLGRLLRWSLNVPAHLLPAEPLPAGFESAGVGEDFYEMLQAGRVDSRAACIAVFTGPSEVTLDTGEALAADLVVCATGWRQNLDFLAPELRALARTDEGFTLYRHILPPGETRLCFNGFGSSISNQLTAEVSAHWIAQLFRGELTLPDVPAMQAEIARVREWIGRVMPARREGYFIGGFAAHHADDLLRDMGLPTVRTRHFLAEYFKPFWADRFADLGAQRRQLREGKTPLRQGFYFSAWHALALVAALGIGAYALL